MALCHTVRSVYDGPKQLLCTLKMRLSKVRNRSIIKSYIASVAESWNGCILRCDLICRAADETENWNLEWLTTDESC